MASRAWLAHLETFGIKLGLETIRAIVSELGSPHRACPVLHIAGTNGKGSVSAMVSTALTAAGLRTARYTSPHLVHLEERFAIDGRPVRADQLDDALSAVAAAAARLRERGSLQVEPTYFEATTAAAFLLFRTLAAEIAVIEVGLGGRFDATNIVEPLATAIVSIALDHQAQLGESLSEIAAEKAGIVKPGVPVVVGPLPGEAREVVSRVANERRSALIDASADTRVEARVAGGSHDVTFASPVARYGPLRLALAGQHQVENAAVAVRLLETAAAQGIPISPEAVVRGLASARWPARLQSISTPRGTVVVDGAHNPAGAAALSSWLRTAYPDGLPLIVGMMSDKDAAGVLAPLTFVARPLIVTRAPGARAADPEALAQTARALAPGVEVLVEAMPEQALERAWAFGPRVAVAGSLYLAGQVLALLGDAE